MDRETLKGLMKEIEDIQHRTVRLGGRIQLSAYLEPDHQDITPIPEEIDELKAKLDKLKGDIEDKVLGLYDVVYYEYTNGDPRATYRDNRPAHYSVIKARVERANLYRQEAGSDNLGYFQAVSMDDIALDSPIPRWVHGS